MHRALSLLAGLCLAGLTLASAPASAGPTPLTSLSTPHATAVPVHYPWWRDREWRRERYYRQHSYGGYCARLRRACEYKHERGEAGQGNCRRYRSECGR
jgi:hypothetical protein